MALGPHRKRINLTLHEMSVDMLETISSDTRLTKSQIMQQLLRVYTLDFWSEPKEELERWKNYAKKIKEQKKS